MGWAIIVVPVESAVAGRVGVGVGVVVPVVLVDEDDAVEGKVLEASVVATTMEVDVVTVDVGERVKVVVVVVVAVVVMRMDEDVSTTGIDVVGVAVDAGVSEVAVLLPADDAGTIEACEKVPIIGVDA